MALLQRQGVDIYYEIHGSGPALLLTHGFSATSQMWQGQIAALAERHTLILWDMRGHGRSGAPEDAALYNESLTIGDMAALLDQAGAQQGIIGGLSLGGYMSLAFHAEWPERVKALLIIDTGPGYKRDDAREAWNRQALETAENIATHGLEALADASAERSQSEHNNVQGLAMAGRHMLTQHSPRVILSLPQIAVPSLVVAGAQDTPFLAATDYMAAKIPGAEKLIIERAGHAVNIDQPEAFNAGVLQFLTSRGL